MFPNEQDDQENIVEHINYFNVLIQSIQNINSAIMQEKNAMDAAYNLLTDLPDDWSEEIRDKTDAEVETYRKVVYVQEKNLERGTSNEQKLKAKEKINIAGKTYSRNVKKIIISLLKKKNLLYQTRKQVERGALSLWQLGESDKEDE